MDDTVNWDDFDLKTEAISGDDVKNADSNGRAPAGTYLCECIDSTPRQQNGKEYSYVQANLKWKILEAKKIGDIDVEDGEHADLQGKFIWDSISMQHPSEKPGTRNRRVLVASKTGLLDNSAELTAASWKTDIIGRQSLITTFEDTYTDKYGATQKIVKVKFDGYQKVADGAGKDTAVDALADL